MLWSLTSEYRAWAGVRQSLEPSGSRVPVDTSGDARRGSGSPEVAAGSQVVAGASSRSETSEVLTAMILHLGLCGHQPDSVGPAPGLGEPVARLGARPAHVRLTEGKETAGPAERPWPVPPPRSTPTGARGLLRLPGCAAVLCGRPARRLSPVTPRCRLLVQEPESRRL